jgi:lipoprotein-releasing system permease protein
MARAASVTRRVSPNLRRPSYNPAVRAESYVAGLLKSLPFSLALGLSLFSGRRRSRVSAATLVSILGIGVGVATLTAVLAVTGGFEAAFRDKILGVYPHLVVLARGEPFTEYPEATQTLSRLPGVAGTNPSTYDEMMISADGGTAGVIVKGVDLDGVDRVSSLRSLTRGKDLTPLRWREGEPMGVLLGCALMDRLKAKPGDRVSLTTPVRGLDGGGSGPFGMAPVQQAFVVRDCFESGFWEYDSRLVVLDLAAAQKFLGRGTVVRWIEMRLTDMFATEDMRREVLSTLQPFTLFEVVQNIARLQRDLAHVTELALPPPEAQTTVVDLFRAVHEGHQALEYSDLAAGPVQRYRLIDWKEMNRNLFGALRTQKVVLALFFLIIVLVAAFNIVGTQLIVARERVKEVSTLVALGASRRQLARVFVVHGFTLGFLGVAVGLGLGWLVVRGIASIDFALDPRVYLISELPATLSWTDALAIGGLSLAVVLVSCLLSSWRATRLNPVDGLRKIA